MSKPSGILLSMFAFKEKKALVKKEDGLLDWLELGDAAPDLTKVLVTSWES